MKSYRVELNISQFDDIQCSDIFVYRYADKQEYSLSGSRRIA